MMPAILTLSVTTLLVACCNALPLESPGNSSGEVAVQGTNAAPQTPVNPAAPLVNQQQPPVGTPDGSGVSAPDELLSYSVLIFGAIVLFLVVFVMIRTKMPWNDASFKALVLPLLLISGLFLITAGYSKDQITGMMGLLGSIAGYILGKSSGIEDRPQPVSPADDQQDGRIG